jgi:hypothetical protein
VKVVVPFKETEINVVEAQALQLLENGNISGKNGVTVAHPEMENVSKKINGAAFFLPGLEEGQKLLIVGVTRI